jgi:hypothetical protein
MILLLIKKNKSTKIMNIIENFINTDYHSPSPFFCEKGWENRDGDVK